MIEALVLFMLVYVMIRLRWPLIALAVIYLAAR